MRAAARGAQGAADEPGRLNNGNMDVCVLMFHAMPALLARNSR